MWLIPSLNTLANPRHQLPSLRSMRTDRSLPRSTATSCGVIGECAGSPVCADRDEDIRGRYAIGRSAEIQVEQVRAGAGRRYETKVRHYVRRSFDAGQMGRIDGIHSKFRAAGKEKRRSSGRVQVRRPAAAIAVQHRLWRHGSRAGWPPGTWSAPAREAKIRRSTPAGPSRAKI